MESLKTRTSTKENTMNTLTTEREALTPEMAALKAKLQAT